MDKEPIPAVEFDATTEQTWSTLRFIWSKADSEQRDLALGNALESCAEHYPELLPGVFKRGLSKGNPAAEQKAFARQIGILGQFDSKSATDLFRVIRERRTPGLLKAALEGLAPMRETDPERLALLLAEIMIVSDSGGTDWKRARSVLFAGTHSGEPALRLIEPALRSDDRNVRNLTAKSLLPELAERGEYGTAVLDLIENRLDQDDDPAVVQKCVALLPVVYARRPGQAKRIIRKAWDWDPPNYFVRDALARAMHLAGMESELPGHGS